MATAKPVLEKFVVVFSQNYLPLCQVNIKRAIVLLIINKAEPLLGYTEGKWRLSQTWPESPAKFWMNVQANLE